MIVELKPGEEELHSNDSLLLVKWLHMQKVVSYFEVKKFTDLII